MKNITALILILTVITSCVSEAKYDELDRENSYLVYDLKDCESEVEIKDKEIASLKQEIADLRKTNTMLESEKISVNIKEKEPKEPEYYTEDQAMRLLKKHRDLYLPNLKLRKLRLSRIGPNRFIVRFEEYKEEYYNWIPQKYSFVIEENEQCSLSLMSK